MFDIGRKTQQNNITSLELLKKTNAKNIRLKNDFITYLKSVGRSETTIKSYVNDLDIFFVFLLQNCDNKFFVDVTKKDIIFYQNWLLSENGNSPARIRRLKSTLSSLSNYIESICDEEFPNFKPIIKKVESPVGEPVREKTVLSEEQLEYLLTTLVEKKKYQKACAVALAAYSGARKSELVRFKVDYFTDDNIIYGSLYKTYEKIKTKGRGKGKFIEKFIIVDKFKPYLDLWLKHRKELGIESNWLFVTKNKDGVWNQTKSDTLNSWALTNSKILGLPFYFHSMRHFFTTFLHLSGLPDTVIKSIVGWNSIEMVSRYNDISIDEELGQYFDENGIKTTEKVGLSDL